MSSIIDYLENHQGLFTALAAIVAILGGVGGWIIIKPPPIKALEFTGRWVGTSGSVYDGKVFDLHAHLHLVNTQWEGQIEYTLKESPPGTPWAKRVGKSGVEFVKGFLVQQRLFLTGYRVDNPRLLEPSDYVIELDERHEEFEGISPDGQGPPAGSLSGSLKVLR